MTKEGEPLEAMIHRRVTLFAYAPKLVLSAPMATVIEVARIWTALSCIEPNSGDSRAWWDRGVMSIKERTYGAWRGTEST